MKTIPAFKFISLTAAVLSLALLSGGCGKGRQSDGASDDKLSARLETIRQAGQPVTLAELHTWYAEPPAAENAAVLYQEAFAALTAAQADSPAFLTQNQKALPLLHQAVARKKCRYPVDLTAGLTATMPYLASVKKCAQLLEKDTAAQAAKGRMDLAAQSVLDGLHLAQSLAEEPLLISQLVRVATESITQGGLRQALDRRPFSDEQLAVLSTALREAENATGFTRAFVGERCFGIAFFQLPAAEQAKLIAQMGKEAGGIDFETYRKKPAYTADADFYLDCMDGYIAAAGQSFPGSLEAASQLAGQGGEARDKGHVISAVLLPALGTAIEKAADAAARLRLARVALAVERHRLAHQNALPETLDQLVPQFLDAVPADPYDGRPLRYAKTPPKGYTLYSVGKDRKDDGGMLKLTGNAAAPDVTFAVQR